jgi:predicted phosphodiesterase
MRYGIFSDIHANLEALEAVIDAYDKESVDAYLCIGDLVGYAVNPKECIKIVQDAATVTVAGNHDWAAADLFSTDYFNEYAAEAISWTKNNLDAGSKNLLKALGLIYVNKDLTLVHGTLDAPAVFQYTNDEYSAQATFGLLETKACFIGHTHVPGYFVDAGAGRIAYFQEERIHLEEGKKYIVNVGSVGQPRDGNPQASFCVYDTETKDILIKRAGYDAGAARKKIIEAGLPRFLGDRLLIGR